MAGLMSVFDGQGDWLERKLRAAGAGPRVVALGWPVGALVPGTSGRGFRIMRRRQSCDGWSFS